MSIKGTPAYSSEILPFCTSPAVARSARHCPAMSASMLTICSFPCRKFFSLNSTLFTLAHALTR